MRRGPLVKNGLARYPRAAGRFLTCHSWSGSLQRPGWKYHCTSHQTLPDPSKHGTGVCTLPEFERRCRYYPGSHWAPSRTLAGLQQIARLRRHSQRGFPRPQRGDAVHVAFWHWSIAGLQLYLSYYNVFIYNIYIKINWLFTWKPALPLPFAISSSLNFRATFWIMGPETGMFCDLLSSNHAFTIVSSTSSLFFTLTWSPCPCRV